MLCNYGCGQEATVKTSNGYVCSEVASKCLAISSKISKSRKGVGGTVKAVWSQTNKFVCDYGCNQTALFKFSNGKWCCSQTIKQCPEHRSLLQRRRNQFDPRLTKVTPFDYKTLLPLQKCSYGCGQPAKFYYRNGKWSCSKHCSACPTVISRSKRGAKGKTGGYRPTAGRGKKGYYRGIWCDSSYELAWVIFHLEHETIFERCKDEFKYSYKGKEYTYHPDFKSYGSWVEIKGYASEKWEAKESQFPYPDKLIVLFAEDMPDIFEYVVKKYGDNFVQLYE